MKTKLLFVIVMIFALLAACVPAAPGGVAQPTQVVPTQAPANTPVVIVPSEVPASPIPTDKPVPTGTSVPTVTPVPTIAPIPVRLVVKSGDQSITLVDPNINLGAAPNPAFDGLNPKGGVIAGTAYVYVFTDSPRVMAVDENGTRQLDFIQKPTYGLAVWSGSEPRLAWGTQLIVPNSPSSLQISAPDGSQLETLYTQGASDPAVQLVAQFWSADGKSLYFSREPSGIGGYILFDGASSLYKIDLASKQVSEVIPVKFSSGMICLDAVTADLRYVADHCAQNVITIRDLTSGGTTTIQPPDGLTGFKVLGSARFSPDGSRVAYALAKSNPDAEQGWVAVSDGLEGSSKLIMTGDAGIFYNVVGWLDDQTLLVQSNPIPGCASCDNELWTVKVDGSNLTNVAFGSFLAMKDNR
jgi:hypothetical protein